MLGLYEVTASAQDAPGIVLRDRKGRQFYAKKEPLAVVGRAAVEEARVYRMGIVASEAVRDKFQLPAESFAVDFKLITGAREMLISQLAGSEGRLIAVVHHGTLRGWLETSPLLLNQLKVGVLPLMFDTLEDAREVAQLLTTKVQGPGRQP